MSIKILLAAFTLLDVYTAEWIYEPAASTCNGNPQISAKVTLDLCSQTTSTVSGNAY